MRAQLRLQPGEIGLEIRLFKLLQLDHALLMILHLPDMRGMKGIEEIEQHSTKKEYHKLIPALQCHDFGRRQEGHF